jgi:tRNA threonylcarbamoyladenosine biosynthesis protein TsaE
VGAVSQRVVTSHSPEETFALGQRLGRLLQPGDFIGLVGDLGAGKTHLARGVAEGLEVPKGQVASPTFAIVYPYRGRIPLFHADFYRLGDYDELYATGFFDLLSGEGAVLVEWLDRVWAAAPEDRIVIFLEEGGESVRTLKVHVDGPRSTARVGEWLGELPPSTQP